MMQSQLNRTWHQGLVTILLMLGAACDARAQSNLPEWRLSQRFSTEQADLELHRVRASTLLLNGSIAIADEGNLRIVIVSPRTGNVQTIGREGSGPGDFRSIADLGQFGDTLLAYDAVLNRVTLFHPDGKLIRTVSLPSPEGHPVTLRAFAASDQYLVTSHMLHQGDRPGLQTDTAAIMLFSAATRSLSSIGRRVWQTNYFYPHEGGNSAYGTPFLGRSWVAVAGNLVVTVPLGSLVVEIAGTDGRDAGQVRLPVRLERFDRAIVDRYRDSLINVVRPRASQFPGAIERIQVVFGPAFPTPQYRPITEVIRSVGKEIWVKIFPPFGANTATWYVVDPVGRRLAGRLNLPRNWSVLGGDERSVLVLQRDSYGVEHVVLYGVVR